MPPKTKKKSAKFTENDTRKQSLSNVTQSVGDSVFVFSKDMSFEQLEEEFGESKHRIEPVLSRTSMLLLDYRQFKAARTIQTAVRGWLARRKLAKQQRSASRIQRAWRGFYAKHYVYRILEERLQETLWKHYNKSAVKIQALWRGFWVRENVHDQFQLSRMQVYAAEELLQCVAFKLHHLLRTYQIPGIYSLRNSHCLSKVEQLLAAITFKQHNDRVRLAQLKRNTQITVAKYKFGKSTYRTQVPYPGPDFKGICEPKACEEFQGEEADRKMHKILNIYRRATAVDPRTKLAKHKSLSRKLAKSLRRIEENSNFCGDVVRSMQRWKILTDNNLTVDPNVFRNPKNVENFLTEAQSILSLIEGRCNCNVDQQRLRQIQEQA